MSTQNTPNKIVHPLVAAGCQNGCGRVTELLLRAFIVVLKRDENNSDNLITFILSILSINCRYSTGKTEMEVMSQSSQDWTKCCFLMARMKYY